MTDSPLDDDEKGKFKFAASSASSFPVSPAEGSSFHFFAVGASALSFSFLPWDIIPVNAAKVCRGEDEARRERAPKYTLLHQLYSPPLPPASAHSYEAEGL